MTTLDITDMPNDVILVTGGAGFIGSAAIRHLIRDGAARVINIDALTYAANLANLTEVDGDPRYRFERVDICSVAGVERIFTEYRPTAVMHLPPRPMSTARSTTRWSSCRPMCSAPRRCLRSPAVIGARSLRPTATASAFTMSRPMRFTVLWERPAVQRAVAVSTQLAIRGEQGGRRPSGARLARDLWLAGRHQQLLEQFRALPVSGKIHPVDDHQCAGRSAAAGLRTRG